MTLSEAQWELIRGELFERPGVRGVFLGQPRRDRRWLETTAVCVHVERKLPAGELPPDEAVPATIEDLPTDIIEVGPARLYAAYLDTRDVIITNDGSDRHSTLTAVVDTAEGVLGLGAGHGLLPFTGTGFSPGPHAPGRQVAYALDEVGTFFASVSHGAVDGKVDYAVARFSPAKVLNGNYHCPAPIPWKRGLPQPGTVVVHRPAGRAPIHGRVAHHLGDIILDALLPGRRVPIRYGPVFSVRGLATTFSRPGDSGSLILDETADTALGVLVGGSSSKNLSYALPLGPLIGALGGIAKHFFADKETT